LLGTSSGHTIEGQAWYYIEIKAKIDSTVGTVEIKVGGIQRLNLTGKNTQNGSNAYVGAYRIRWVNPLLTWYDDHYVLDTTGSAPNNDFLGDRRIDKALVNGAGTHTDFTPSAGANYQNVDEIPADGDTTYNYSGTVNNQDSYALANLTALGTTINGIRQQAQVRKDDAGTRKCYLQQRSGTTDYNVGSEIILNDVYKTHNRICETDPNTSAAWTESGINALEVGIKDSA